MSRVALLLVLLSAARASAADLPPGAVARLGDDRFRTGGGVRALALAPDGKRFATASDAGGESIAVAVWDADTGRPLHMHAVNRELFAGLVWGKEGAFAVLRGVEPGAKGGAWKVAPHDFRVWDFTDPKAAPPLLAPRGIVEREHGGILDAPPKPGGEYTAFHLSADGSRVAAEWESADGKFAVHVFELKPATTATKLTRAGTIDFGAEPVGAVRLSADGKTLVAFRAVDEPEHNRRGDELTATAWDVARGKPDKPVRVPLPPGVRPVVIDNPDRIGGRLMLAPDARTLVVHATDETEWGFDAVPLAMPYKAPLRPRQRVRWPNPEDQPRDSGGYAFSPSGKVLVVAAARNTFILDATTGKELGRLEGHAATPTAVAVSADGARIATADGCGLVRLWDAKTFHPLHDATGHRAPVEHAQLSSDGKRLLTWADDETVRLWDVGSGKELRAFAGATDDARPVFASGETAVAYSGKKGLIARDLQTGLEVPLPDDAKALEPRAAVLATHWLSAASHPFAGVRLHEVASGEVRRTLRGHRGEVRVLGFTPDGTKLLTAGGDHTILVWDVRLQAVPLPEALKKETNAAKLWDALATGKADAAYLAMARLGREPDAALKLVKLKLKPAATGDRETDATNLTDARAVELLEALDTDESRAYLKELTSGAADAFRTREAKRAQERHR